MIRNYTYAEIAAIAASMGESWSATPQLRYVERQSASWMDEPTHIVLQQLWQGSNGSQKWEDVPTVREE